MARQEAICARLGLPLSFSTHLNKVLLFHLCLRHNYTRIYATASASFALSAEFSHSWLSLQKCLLSSHLAQQGKQIRMAYAAVTGRPPLMSVLGWAVKQ